MGKTKDQRGYASAAPDPVTPLKTPEPGRWRRALASGVELLRQETAVAGDLELLQDYARLQRQLWDTRAGRLESQITQMKKESRMERRVEAARLELLMGLEKHLARCYKDQSVQGSPASGTGDPKTPDTRKDLNKSFEAARHDKKRTATAAKTAAAPETDDAERKRRKKVKKLRAYIESLQTNIAERDASVAELKKDIKRRRREAKVAKKEILRLRKEVETLRASAKEKDETIAILQCEATMRSGGSRRGKEKSSKSHGPTGGGGPADVGAADPVSPDPILKDGQESQAVKNAGLPPIPRSSSRISKLESLTTVRNSVKSNKRGATPAAVPQRGLFSGTFKVPKLKGPSPLF